MFDLDFSIAALWSGLGWPLLRLLFFVSIGLLLANLIESLNWIHKLSRVASPLIRRSNFSDLAGASFVTAFFSGVAANSMLAEGFDQRKIGKRELVLANLFNSLPTYFLHLPTLFFLSVPLIKGAGLIYVGLTLLAAALRTFAVMILGRLLLAAPPESCVSCHLETNRASGWRQVLALTWRRYKIRIRRILVFILPIYVLFHFLLQLGVFDRLERMLSDHFPLLAWLHPKSMSIVVLQLGAEAGVALAAAGALLHSGTLGSREIVLALLAGNVLSSPLRAVRHQFPYYAGIFSPRLALELIVYNQGLRAVSIILVGAGYYFLGHAS